MKICVDFECVFTEPKEVATFGVSLWVIGHRECILLVSMVFSVETPKRQAVQFLMSEAINCRRAK